MTPLTRDNHPLSEANHVRLAGEGRSFDLDIAINCNFNHSDIVADLVLNSLAENTRRAYLADIEHFRSWGGRIPCDPRTFAVYLAAHAEKLSVATLTRRLAAITRAHDLLDCPSPVRSKLVAATLRGIRRRFGVRQRGAKPLLRDDLFLVLDTLREGTRDLRDCALLLIGFAGALRRSEIVGLDASDIKTVQQGLIIHLRRSKTDQEGAGRKIGIPYGRIRHCPVRALQRWRECAAIEDGPMFRPVDRHGRVGLQRLSADAVSLIVKERVRAIGFDEAKYSGHSLRSGFATSAAQAGVSQWRIRQQTGHTSDAMLARYIRDGELFSDNGAETLL
jgi:integrase